MACYQDFRMLLQKLQCSSRYTMALVIKDISARIQEASKTDLQEILELCTLTHDKEIQVKLFSVLAIYLISNGINYEVIVRYNPIYECIQSLLVRCLNVATILNFVLALLTSDESSSRLNLVTHAYNMIRISGCLNTMAEMFGSGMVYQDTWVALCHCLAEACRSSDANKSYCSHLIPLSIQRCCQGNMDVCIVLQSLLLNHDRNIQLFLENNGLNIFTRQNLQYSTCMQLLSTVVERSEQAVSVLKTSDILDHLQNFLKKYGPYSQMGKWATIILYRLGTQFYKPNIQTTNSANNTRNLAADNIGPINNRSSSNINITERSQNKHIVTSQLLIPPSKNRAITKHTNIQEYASNSKSRISSDAFKGSPNNTATLFQNVIREVIHWKSRNDENFKSFQKIIPPPPRFNERPVHQAETQSRQNNQSRNMFENWQNRKYNKKDDDITFSFLEKDWNLSLKSQVPSSATPSENFNTTFNVSWQHKEVHTSISVSNRTKYHEESLLDINFRPPFMSTPKRDQTLKSHTKKPKTTAKDSSAKANKSLAGNPHLNRHASSPTNGDNRSMSVRLFRAINESCTTIVKSMKSIFRSKDEKRQKDDKTNTVRKDKTRNISCSYSFTNYMHQRDTLLGNDLTGSSYGNYKVNSCKTCKDTIILQNKMANDDSLKQTVKKLKFGLNLYGCDFKKISRTLWSRDKYMTPEILYNLYRKLIVKGGHDNHEFRLQARNVIKHKY